MYNTNRPVTGMMKDGTPSHELSNIVYVNNFHCENDYICRTSQLFHDTRDQHVTKKAIKVCI